MYTLILKDAQRVGQVMTALEKQDISNIDISKTEYSKSEELLLQLKSKAILKARKNAEYLTTPLDQYLGKVIYISDLDRPSNLNQLLGKSAGIQIRGASSFYGNNSSIEELFVDFKKMKFTASLVVKFALE